MPDLREIYRLREAEDLAAVREGLAQAEHGEGRPAEEVFAELRAKHALRVTGRGRNVDRRDPPR